MTAEAAERELREAVHAIKYDFEVRYGRQSAFEHFALYVLRSIYLSHDTAGSRLASSGSPHGSDATQNEC